MTSLKSAIKRIFGNELFIIVVSGLPRSGTSMMMSALKAGGMPLLVDGIREADGNNPRGYYEYEPVKKLPKGSVDWLKSAKGKAVKIISALIEYLPSNNHYKVIFMERDIEEILASQQRMLARRGVVEDKPASDEDMQKSYQAHLKQVKSYFVENDWLDVIYVSYNKVLKDPDGEFQRVAKFLENVVDPSAMSRVVDPELYRERH
jgi:hypothetical protein